jgi:hypothetical protein
MVSNIAYAPDIPTTLQSVTNELRRLQDVLMLAEDLDPRILADFRDVINRVRNTAWAVHQYGELIADEKEPNPIGSILAGERVRTVCQLCKLLENDLGNSEIHFTRRSTVRTVQHHARTGASLARAYWELRNITVKVNPAPTPISFQCDRNCGRS